MSFSDPARLWMLAILAPLLLLEWRAARRADAALERLVGSRPGHALLAQRLPGQRRVGTLLRTAAAALLAVGAAGPEWGHELVRRGAMGSDVVLVMDVSASMDVRDVPPSRLEEARREALAVLDHLQGSKVGVVAFAGDAVRLCPLTLDRSAARLVLESLSSGTVSLPGTDLGRGLRAAARLLPARRRSEQAIVLWTDGEDLEQAGRGSIEELARAGLRVFAVGVGTPAGDIVPVLDDQGRAVDVKRDEGGAVRSRLDEDLLRALARGTRGGYFSASRPGGELLRLVATLGSLAHGGRGERLVERPVPRFPWFAAAAVALLASDQVRRRRRRGEGETRNRTTAWSAAAALLVLAVPHQAACESAWAKGDRAFREERWAAAESLYAARARRGAPAEVQVNLAVTRARLGRATEAEEGLRRSAARDDRVGRIAGYDLGTLLAERGAYDEALKELRRSLERDPGDEDARFNYEWVLRHQRQPRADKRPPPKPRREPSQPSPRGAGPGPSAGAPGPSPPPPSAPRSGQDVSRQQAEQLLGSLQELERLERQRLRSVRVMRERRGRDW